MSDFISSISNAANAIRRNTDVRNYLEKFTAIVKNLTPLEKAVWEATSEEPWGPTATQMKEVSDYTYHYDSFHGVMTVLYSRMFQDNEHAWRRVYKGLVLLNYMLAHGSERVISSAKENVYKIRGLQSYKYIDEKGKDQGLNVRHRAGLIVDLLQDEEKLRAERKKAKNDAKDKYQGFTADDIRMGRGGSYNSSRSKSTWDDDDSYKHKDTWEEEKKEARSYDYSDDRTGSNSPELGFRDDRKANDDDFGDFVEARSDEAKTSPTSVNTSSLGRISVPGGRNKAASNGTATAVQQPVQQTTNFFNLLDINDTPAVSKKSPNVSAAPEIDLFSSFNAAPVSNSAAVRPPRPPSGGSAQSSPVGGMPDLFAAAPAPQTNQTSLVDDFFGAQSTIAVQPASHDFSLFSSNAAAPVVPTPSHNIQGSSNFNLLDDLPVPASAPLKPAPAVDFGFMTSNSPNSPSLPPVAVSAPSSSNKQDVKVSGAWADAFGIVDFDNLGSRQSQKKPGVPMNQMSGKPSNNLSLF